MSGIDQPHHLYHVWETLISGRDRSIRFSGLWGTSRTFLLARLQKARSHPLLIITSTPSDAERAFEDLRFFLQETENDKEGSDEPCLFPQWEILPFDDKSPHPEIVRERLTTLFRLLRGDRPIIITTIRAVMQRLLPAEVIRRGSFDFQVGESWDMDLVIEEISHFGYRQCDLVEVPGTFSRRGGIIDLFPPNHEDPVRLEFFGDEIESIRLFSPEDQRSFQNLSGVEIILSREILMDPPALEEFRKKTVENDHPLSSRLENGDVPEGVEFYAPLFYPLMEPLFDYLPADTVIVLESAEELLESADSFHKEIEERHALATYQERMPCKTSTLYLSPEELAAAIKERRSIDFGLVEEEGVNELQLKTESIGLLPQPGQSRIDALCQAIGEMKKEGRICITVRTQGQADRLMELLIKEKGIPCTRYNRFTDLTDNEKTLAIVTGPLSAGFRFPLFDLTCITEDEIFGVKRVHRPSRLRSKGPFITSLSELKEGDFVVHIDHGIGRYLGLREVLVEGIDRDLIRIEYAGEDLLYVPPEKIELIQKYSGSEDLHIQLNRLGGSGWEKLKGKVKKSIEEISQELIALYAQRKVAKGFAFSSPDHLFREFEETFEYEETPDQQKAIEEVLKDMQKPEPMDRLVCGDVGFGKTEVAIRAAFKAVLDGRQVAILVPTTLLAQQHYESFSRRLSSFPVIVEMLSRFKSRGEQKKILERLTKGEVDILIGTHRLLSRDVAFKDVGLIIIDEEQRFGVRHKEKFKQLREEVDVLTLTATPIPRTLEMAFLRIRDISIINTPPENRLSIYTRISRFSDGIVREAVLRELDRGGQIFFVHNRVRNIDQMAGQVQRIVPEARVDVAHGQMDEKHLKEVMVRFLDQETDLLVTTSIIESGLDIPNANTMIIHQPEEFGLGQLYQLRGRIGRTHHRAYAYLLTRTEKSMTREARKRLQVIQELTELGSGFQLAARDLEIRGAGNLLGSKQSGFITAVGFDLFMQIIDEVAADLKGETKEKPVEPSINLRVTARIPKAYVREDGLRLDLYRRLAGVNRDDDLMKISDEIRDRFGTPPKEVENLFRLIELRILARSLHILEIREQVKRVLFTFAPDTPVSQERILQSIQSYPGRLRPASEFQLEFLKPKGGFHETWTGAKKILQELL